ncbi:uncharacterized protein LOC124450352 isoform X2 [Xenia sp. Carnegie-2017]|uniref:uncharacterized protein LOC124450352 isoform X2 n=1 Tax=Xenia sp. Carnegie-2017 TaxID=2897299 RepID=UPI001F04C5D0|nr:uncharacterized protein LOC124450352 isoform X2 [Xenia sp. Carnegie-2017]
MYRKLVSHLLIWAFFLLEQGSDGFFVKHLLTGMCVNDTAKIQSYDRQWGSLSFVELSDNCFDPAAQFRFLNTSAIINIKRQGCLAGFNRPFNGHNLSMFYLYIDAFSPYRDACTASKAITPTSWGGLSTRVETVPTPLCAVNASFPGLRSQGVDPYLNLTQDCSDAADKRFHFGSVTCFGQNITNANCPKGQYMIIKTASYRGLSEGKNCGSHYKNFSCSVDVTCYLKRHCDGRRECNVTVDDGLFLPSNVCPGLSKYLYFEYQCSNNMTSFNESCHITSGFFIKHLQSGKCIRNTGLMASTIFKQRGFYYLELSDNCLDPAAQFTYLDNGNIMKLNVPGCLRPNQIFGPGYGLHMLYIHFSESGSINQIVCSTSITQTSWGGLTMKYDQHSYEDRCLVNGSFSPLRDRQGVDAYIRVTNCDERLNKTFHFGSLTCSGHRILNVSCSNNQYMKIKTASYRGLTKGNICGSSYNYSCSVDVTCDLKGHCDGQHKCKVLVNDNLFSSNICPQLNKYLYFEYECTNDRRSLKEDSCSHICDLPILNDRRKFPDYLFTASAALKDHSADAARISSGSSWCPPNANGNHYLQLNFQRHYEIETLTIFGDSSSPKWVYEYHLNVSNDLVNWVSVLNENLEKAFQGNKNAFTDAAIKNFSRRIRTRGLRIIPTKYVGQPCLRIEVCGRAAVARIASFNISTKFRSSSTLTFTWEPPKTKGQHGVNFNYTTCLSRTESGVCFLKFKTMNREWGAHQLNASTKYFIQILANGAMGEDFRSESLGFYTNGKPLTNSVEATKRTLIYELSFPKTQFQYFYVVAFKIENGQQLLSSEQYKTKDLLTYEEAMTSKDSKPYIAAVIINDTQRNEKQFTLGDGRYTNEPIKVSNKSRSFYNGPLEPGTSYRVFQRVIVDNEDQYSTEWSDTSETSRPKGRPTVLTNMTSNNVEAKKGETVILACSAQGERPLTFSWTKNNKSIQSYVDNHAHFPVSFTIVHVKDEDDFGEYVCHAQTKFASTNYSIEIIQEAKPAAVPRIASFNISTKFRSSSTLTFTWEPPKTKGQHGVNFSYTTCLSRTESGVCFLKFKSMNREWTAQQLNPSTKYFIQIIASGTMGESFRSESVGFYTNGKPSRNSIGATERTLTYELSFPKTQFQYFFFVALKKKNGKQPLSSEQYEIKDLLTYEEAVVSKDSKPYIAAVIMNDTQRNEKQFTLGDGRYTNEPMKVSDKSRRFHNGPLESGASYIIFQRVIVDNEDQYSTEWSDASETSRPTEKPSKAKNTTNSNVTTEKGEKVKLLCSAQDEGPLTFSWTKNNKSIQSYVDNHAHFPVSFIIVHVKDEDDFGEYICHIQSKFASTNHSIEIIQEAKQDEPIKNDGKFLALLIVFVIWFVFSLVVIFYMMRYRRRSFSIEGKGGGVRGKGFGVQRFHNNT